MSIERLELFPTIVYRMRLPSHATHLASCIEDLNELFGQCETQASHLLEVGDAVSTFNIERRLFQQEGWQDLAEDIREVAATATGFETAFVEMWANRHRRGGRTLEHMHGAHVCGAYYLQLPEGSGSLVFRDPLEYTLCGAPQIDARVLAKTDGVAQRVDVQTGDIVLFPGWLKHFTEPSLTDEPRVVVSFNLSITGYKTRT